MPKQPPIHELDFLKLTGNHAEFAQKLGQLGIFPTDLRGYAEHVCGCWFRLADEHLLEAKSASSANCERSAYSRSYYAAYNASKAARYMVLGIVSRKGDDHGDASAKLPQDLPNVAHWSQQITTLYEHRLRADYDNWSDTISGRSITPDDSVKIADQFIAEVRKYLNGKFGINL